MDSEVKRVEPLSFLNNEVEQEQKWLDTLEICLAMCSVAADETYVEGAHRIGGLWRISLRIRTPEHNHSAHVSI